MTHGHDHHGGHHDGGGHHHHHGSQASPGFPVPYSCLPRTTVQHTYQLPTTTTTVALGTPLLEPRQPSRALIGLITCIFCFVVAIVVFVLWI